MDESALEALGEICTVAVIVGLILEYVPLELDESGKKAVIARSALARRRNPVCFNHWIASLCSQ
jgi:hypothetical protein